MKDRDTRAKFALIIWRILGLASFLMTSLVIVHEISHPRNRQAIAAAWVSYSIPGVCLLS